MALFAPNALWRSQKRHVYFSIIKSLLGRGFQAPRKPRVPHVRDLNTHYLRDIGLDPNDIAAQAHDLPSQHTHHPRG